MTPTLIAPQPGDVVRMRIFGPAGPFMAATVEGIEEAFRWDGQQLDGWHDRVVLKLPDGRRRRVPLGILEESARYVIEGRLC